MNKIEIISYIIFLVHVPLFYFSYNQFYLSFFDFFQLLGFTFLVGTIIISILFFLIRKIKNYNNPIIIFIGLFLFFSYGIFYQFLFDNNISVKHIYLIPVFLSIFILSIKYIPKPSKKIIMVVFTIFLVLIFTDITSFLSNYEFDVATTNWKDSNEFDFIDLSGLPSVIYIIPDEYPSERALKTNLNYDNSQFVHNLTEIGFEINYITSNYMYSDISIPSALNMNYLEKATETIVSFAFFDMDIYKPTKKCLSLIKPHLTKGSILAFDELNCDMARGVTPALKEVFELLTETNIYVDKQAPWTLKNTDLNRMNEVLFISSEIIRRSTILLYPVIPHSCEKIFSIMNINKNNIIFDNFNEIPKNPIKINDPLPVFPRIENND